MGGFMTIVLDGTTGITTPDITSSGSLNIDASAPDDSVVVNASGSVGIGTSSPANLFHVSASGLSTPALIESTSTVSRIAFKDAATTDGNSVRLGSAGNDMSFLAGGAERLRIDSNGKFLVNTTTSLSSSYVMSIVPGVGTGAIIYKNYAGTNTGIPYAFQNTANGTIGYISCNSTSTSYVTSSDYRLKDNIAPMTGALAKVALLKPCTYKWKADGSDGQGFIAHELDEVVPGCVTGEKDAVDAEGNPQYQGIDTSFLVATLTAAIQEQQVLITQQAAAIESLTARVSALEA